MSKNYDWGSPEGPTPQNNPEPTDPPTSQFPAQPGPAQERPQQHFPEPGQQSAPQGGQYGEYGADYDSYTSDNGSDNSGSGGAGKKIGITALVLALVAGVGIGGFQAYKHMQTPEPNPAGISDEVALDFARGDIESCEDIPAQIISAVGIKDYAPADNVSCTGSVLSADGETSADITVYVMPTDGAADAESSGIEGWEQSSEGEMPGDSSLDDVIALINDGSSSSVNNAPRCSLTGTDNATKDVTIIGPTCDVIYPLANQINNLYEQDRYINHNTGFFELKENPDYAPVELATLKLPTFAGFDDVYDAAPDFGAEVTSLQAEFDDSTFVVDGAENDGDDHYCFPAAFTLGEEKDDDSSTFALPRLYVISQSGQFAQVNDLSSWTSLKVGESEDYEYCGSLPNESIPGSDPVRYLVVYSDFDDSGDAVFDTDGELNVIGAFTHGGE